MKKKTQKKKKMYWGFSSPSFDIHLANEAEYHSRKVCKSWINYANICGKAGLICNTLHLVLLHPVSWGVVIEFTLVWRRFYPFTEVSIQRFDYICGEVEPLPRFQRCWVEKKNIKRKKAEVVFVFVFLSFSWMFIVLLMLHPQKVYLLL